MQKAGFWRRFAAIFIDGLLLGAFGYATHNSPASFLLQIAYETILVSQWNGQTVGKKVLGLRVTAPDGGEVDWVKAFVRAISKLLSAIPLGLGYFWMLWDSESQTWHDKLANTIVVRTV